jgi:hypothetical protein
MRITNHLCGSDGRHGKRVFKSPLNQGIVLLRRCREDQFILIPALGG